VNRWLIVAGLLAVLLTAAAASAHGRGWWGTKGWQDTGGKDGGGWGRAAGFGANVALSVVARQVSISGDGIKAVLTADEVGLNVAAGWCMARALWS
jgi:hypothetical protein